MIETTTDPQTGKEVKLIYIVCQNCKNDVWGRVLCEWCDGFGFIFKMRKR